MQSEVCEIVQPSSFPVRLRGLTKRSAEYVIAQMIAAALTRKENVLYFSKMRPSDSMIKAIEDTIGPLGEGDVISVRSPSQDLPEVIQYAKPFGNKPRLALFVGHPELPPSLEEELHKANVTIVYCD